jgi:hypothetical protein
LMYFVVILVYSAKEKSGNPVQINSFWGRAYNLAN